MTAPHSPSVWVLTDGKIGDDVQCLAVAAALAPGFEKRVVAPRAPWSWFLPWGPIDPREKASEDTSPIRGAAPDVVIASGRRAIAYARAVKTISGGKSLVVILKDPRVGRNNADVIWAPMHDRLQCDNAFSTLTSPHHVSAGLDEARNNPGAFIKDATAPMLGVVLGGPSGGAQYGADEAKALAAQLKNARAPFQSLAITPSRRTPTEFMDALCSHLSGDNLYCWDGKGDNPYLDILAWADALIVAADSHNMMSEALSAGTGIYAYRPPGLAAKMGWFVDQLEAKGLVRPLGAAVDVFSIEPVDATPAIVAEIKSRLLATSASV